MPRLWVPGVGPTPYTTKDPTYTHPEDEFTTPTPKGPDATTPPSVSATPADNTYKPPVDSYLQSKIMPGFNIDPFGKVTYNTPATADLPSITSSQPDPASDIYWNNPGRLARYYNAITTAPAGWQPPSWLDPQKVVTAYKQMEAANEYKDWTQWQAFSANDPRFASLQQMALPTADYLMPDEQRYVATAATQGSLSQDQVVNYKDLPLWQQVLTYITPEQEGFADTPWTSKGSSAGISGLLTGLGAYGMGSIALAGLGAIGVAASPALLAVPILLGVGLGGAAMYESLSGNEVKIPVVKDAMQFFDILSKWAEQGIGLSSQALNEGITPFISNGDKLRAAWKASEGTYESGKIETINLFAKTLDFLDFNSNFFQVDVDNLAKPGESWAFNYGIAKPVRNTFEEGAAGLQQLRDKLTDMYQAGATDQQIQDEVEKFKASFYSSGSNNDILFGTIIDPANWMPFISSKIGEAATRRVDPMLADSFRQSRGSLFIDSLPFGVQQGAMAISNSLRLGLKDSSGPLAAVSEYKMRRRYTMAPDARPASEMSQSSRNFLNLTDEGKFAELQPAAARTPRTGLIGRTLDFLDYLSSLTEDSKATTMLDMFHDNLSQTLLDPTLSREQKVEILQKAAGILPADMANVSEQYLGSAAMLTIAEGNKYALQNGGMDVYRSFTEGEKDFIPFVEKTAATAAMTAQDIARAINDPAKVKDLVTKLKQAGMSDADIKTTIKRLKDGLTGSNAIPLTEEEMWTKFSATMYDKMTDYLHETYKLAPESSILRAAHIMKGAQNLMLLGFSPQYLYENFVGNKVAMAAVGVMGFMRPDNIRSLLAEFGLDPARIGEGYTPSGDVTRTFDLAGSEAKTALAAGKKRVQDTKLGRGKGGLFDKAQSAVSGASKLGIASTLSGKVEASDSLQAFTSAMLRFYDGEWKVGRGLQRAPMEQMWEQKYPGISQILYSAIESSKNIPQVYAKLFETFGKPTSADVIKYAAGQTGVDAETLSQTFQSTGITKEIDRGLQQAQTPHDVDNVFNAISDTLTQRLSDTFIREIKGLDGHTTAKVRTEGIPAILRAFTLAETSKLQEMLASKREWDALYAVKKNMTQKEFGERAKRQFQKEADNWERIYQRELMMAKGVTDAFGLLTDKAVKYIQGLEKIQQQWTAFQKRRVELLEQASKIRKRKNETQADFEARRSVEWHAIQDEINKGYAEAAQIEASQAAINDQVFIEAYRDKTGWDPTKVKEWREAVRGKKAEIYQMQADFQAKIANMGPEARSKAWKEFLPTLNTKINELDAIEHQYSTAIMRGTSNAASTSPVIQSVVDAVQAQISEAKARQGQPPTMLNEVLGAQLAALGFDNVDITAMSEPDMFNTLQQGIPAHVVAMMDLANKMGVKDEQGGTNPIKLLNIVKKYMGNPDLKSLRDVTIDDFIQAIKEHRDRHQLETAIPVVRSSLYANQLARITDQVQRENAIKQMGYQTREELKNYWRTSFKVSDQEIEAAMVTADARADQWARERGLEPSTATRDAFYATTFSTDTQDSPARSLKQMTVRQAQALKYTFDAYENSTRNFKAAIKTIAQDAMADLDPAFKLALKRKGVAQAMAQWVDDTLNLQAENDDAQIGIRLLLDNLLELGREQYEDNFDDNTVLLAHRANASATNYLTDGMDRIYAIINTPIGKVGDFEISIGIDSRYDVPAGMTISDLYIKNRTTGDVYRMSDSGILREIDPANTPLQSKENFYHEVGTDKFIGHRDRGLFIPSEYLVRKVLDLYNQQEDTTFTHLRTLNNGVEIYKASGGGMVALPIDSTNGAGELEWRAITAYKDGDNLVIRPYGEDFSYVLDNVTQRMDFQLQRSFSPPADQEKVRIKFPGDDTFYPLDPDAINIADYKQEPGLVALHTMDVGILASALQTFGGPVNPSIGITKYNLDGRFGRVTGGKVTFVLKKSAVDPAGWSLHSGDAWTKMMPYLNKAYASVSAFLPSLSSYRDYTNAILRQSGLDMNVKAKVGQELFDNQVNVITSRRNILNALTNSTNAVLSQAEFDEVKGYLNGTLFMPKAGVSPDLFPKMQASIRNDMHALLKHLYPALTADQLPASDTIPLNGESKSLFTTWYISQGVPADTVKKAVDAFYHSAGANIQLFHDVSSIIEQTVPGSSVLDKHIIMSEVLDALDEPYVSTAMGEAVANSNYFMYAQHVVVKNAVEMALQRVTTLTDTQISSLTHAIHDAIFRPVFTEVDNQPAYTSREALINSTIAKSGHGTDDLWDQFRDKNTAGPTKALLTRHIKDFNQLYADATAHQFEMHVPINLHRHFVIKDMDIPINGVVTKFKGSAEYFQRIRLDFLHFVADVANSVPDLSPKEIEQLIMQWYTSPMGAMASPEAMMFAADPMGADPATRPDVAGAWTKEFYNALPTIMENSDDYMEGRYNGVLKPEDIAQVVFYSGRMSQPDDTTAIIQDWLNQHDIPWSDDAGTSQEDFLIKLLERQDTSLFQRGSKAKGETVFLDDGRALMRGLNAPDVSTLVHEMGHAFIQTLPYAEMNAAARAGGLKGIREYYQLRNAFRTNNNMPLADRQRYVAFEEWFARGWEKYLTEGNAPTPELQSVFKQFTGWMLNIYKRLKNTGGQVSGFDKYQAFRRNGVEIDLKAEVNGRSLKSIFDRMLAGGDTEDIPVYHDLLQSTMNKIKSAQPGMPYYTLYDEAQAKLLTDLQQALNGTSIEDIIASGVTIELPDGTIVDSSLARQISNKGKVRIEAEDVQQLKADATANTKFRAGQAIPFKQLGMLEALPKEIGGPGLYDGAVNIPSKGTYVVRIKGFENKGIHYNVAVYYNGTRVAYLPSNFEGNVTSTVNGKTVTILGFDTTDQSRIVYRAGRSLYIQEAGGPISTTGASLMQGETDVPDDQVPPVGNIPMDSFPEPEPIGSALNDLRRDHIQPALTAMQSYARDNVNNQRMKWGDVDPQTQKEIQDWVDNNVSADMGQTKRLASKYGEMRRDDALINYNKRYGFDEVLGLVYPYEMWYTRTMINWAKRMIDKPQWFAMYARLEEQRKQMEDVYLPNRLKGKVRISAPWLPDWAGGSLYSDPMRRFFPFSTLGSAGQQFLTQGGQIDYLVADSLDEMVKSGEITAEQKTEALNSKQGDIYAKALNDAQAQQSQDLNPMSMANMMMSPAMWWTTPALMADGKNKEITTTPGYRTTQAIQALGQGTGLQPLTDVVGLLGKPESLVREKVLGLDQPTNLFGQYGTYYVNREIANMAADGSISANDAMNAVVQKSGPAWEEAMQRVIYQQTMKVPGALPIQAIKAGASPLQVIGALIAGGFPSSLFPSGEQKYAEMKNQLNLAYDKKNAGDADALSKFYEDYPVYSLRTLIKEDDPKEQLRMVLANQLWQKYNELGGANKRQVRRYLGAEFDQFITNKEYRDMVSVEQLAQWASGLGAKTPSNVKTPAQPASIPYYSAEQDKAYSAYQDWRNTNFPNWYQQQSEYYALPQGTQRTSYLVSHPELKKYMSANAQYKREHPDVAAIIKEQSVEDSWYEEAVNRLTTTQKNQLQNFSMGKRMGEGTLQSLRMLYNTTARDSGLKFEDWVLAITNGLGL